MAEKDWLLGDTPNPLGDRVDEIRDNLKTRSQNNWHPVPGRFTPQKEI